MTAPNGLSPHASEADRQRWLEGWQQLMVRMWRERMVQLSPPVYDTGALMRSVQGTLHPGPVTTIEHHFLEYGIYVCRGTGNGYRPGNGGDLAFLKDWKTNPHHRRGRDWFSRKYLYSLHRLNDFEAAYYGTAYNGLLSTFLAQLFGGGTSRAERAVGRL